MEQTAAPHSSDVVGLEDVELLESVTTIALTSLAGQEVTGELVCACDVAEVHVYLQAGRIAWASDGRHPRAFTGHLKRHAGLGDAAVEAVVSACSSTRQPIGEALLARGLATEGQIRAALRHQIGLALHVGECGREGRTTFTPRSYRQYDRRFTFTASEAIGEEQEVARACYAASARGGPCPCRE